MKVLETKRLLLRPFILEDVVGLHQEIYSDSEVVRYYSGKGVLTPEATLQHLTEHLASWRDEELGRHAVVLKENGTFLGQVPFHRKPLRRVPIIRETHSPGIGPEEIGTIRGFSSKS